MDPEVNRMSGWKWNVFDGIILMISLLLLFDSQAPVRFELNVYMYMAININNTRLY